jgi:hypothetical protein
MLNKLIQRIAMRRMDREQMLLELEVLSAHCNAEFNVIRAERALEDANVRAERAKDDALMYKRWETQKLDIQRRYLTSTAEVMAVDVDVPKVVPITSAELGQQMADAVSRMNPLNSKFTKGK